MYRTLLMRLCKEVIAFCCEGGGGWKVHFFRFVVAETIDRPTGPLELVSRGKDEKVWIFVLG